MRVQVKNFKQQSPLTVITRLGLTRGNTGTRLGAPYSFSVPATRNKIFFSILINQTVAKKYATLERNETQKNRSQKIL